MYYKVSDDPLSWDDKDPIIIKPNGNVFPEGTHYVLVLDDGKIMVSSNTRSEIFVNDGDAAADGWRVAETDQKKSYTRCLTLIQKEHCHQQYLLLTSGGSFQANRSVNTVATGVQDFSDW